MPPTPISFSSSPSSPSPTSLYFTPHASFFNEITDLTSSDLSRKQPSAVVAKKPHSLLA